MRKVMENLVGSIIRATCQRDGIKDSMQEAYQVGDVFDQLTPSFVDVQSDLGDKRICNGKLRDRKSSNGKLTETEKTDAKLGDGNDSIPKLTDCDDSFCRHRYSVRPILEGNMNKGKIKKSNFGFVLETPAIPLFLCRGRSSAVRTGKSLFRNFMMTFPAGFHVPSCFQEHAQKVQLSPGRCTI